MKWNELLKIELSGESIRAMTVAELKAEKKNVIEGLRNLLDACDAQKRDISKKEAAAYDEGEKFLRDVESELLNRPVNEPPGLKASFRADGATRNKIPWEFGKVGVSYRELFGVDGGHDRQETENFLRNVVEGRLPELDQRAMGTGSASSGGAFAPESFAAELDDKAAGDSIFLPRVRRFPCEGSSLNIGAWDGQDQSEGFFAGVEVEWVAENGTFTPKDPKTRSMSMAPQKAGLFTDVSRELMEDAQAIAPVIGPKLAFGVSQTIDEAVLRGNSIGRPLGILEAPATITVERQTAGAIAYLDLVNLYSRIHPAFLKNAIWVINPDVTSELLTMVDGAGSYIWRPHSTAGVASDVPTELLGRPLFTSDKCSQLGSSGDIVLCDPSTIAFVQKRGIVVEMSNSPGWYQDRISFRAIIRVDSMPLISQPIIQRHGTNTLSAFAMLNE